VDAVRRFGLRPTRRTLRPGKDKFSIQIEFEIQFQFRRIELAELLGKFPKDFARRRGAPLNHQMNWRLLASDCSSRSHAHVSRLQASAMRNNRAGCMI
jgi:hypothetical protein